MQGALIRFALSLSLCLSAVTATAAEDEEATAPPGISDRDRVWNNFNREAAVLGKNKFRFAVRGMMINKAVDEADLDLTGFPLDDFEIRQNPPDKVKAVEGGRFALLGSYGLGPMAEIGFDMPFWTTSIKFDNNPTQNYTDFGDLVLYGKVRQMIANNLAAGLGLEIKVPTGIERKRLGTGETAFNPFVSARYTYGRLGFGAHAGYNIYTGTVPDVVNWNSNVLAMVTKKIVLRVELNGRHFKEDSHTYHDVSIYPGLDFHFSDLINIRPQGLVGLTDDAHRWGLGLAIVVNL
jgi:hypothetical protein